MKTTDPAVVTQNANVLANAAALTHAVVCEMGEQNICKTINGESLTRDRIEQMVAMKLTTSIESTVEGV